MKSNAVHYEKTKSANFRLLTENILASPDEEFVRGH